MNVEERLHRMMANVGHSDTDAGAWADFLSVAHRSQTRHRLIAGIAVAAALVAAVFGPAAVLDRRSDDRDVLPADRSIVPVPMPVDVPSECPIPDDVTEGPLGTVAYLGATELHIVDVATGRDEILVQGGPGFGEGFFAGEVRISPDGRWVSFGMGYVVPTSGGGVCAPLGVGVGDLQWTPDGTAVALRSGSLVVGGPGKEPIRYALDSSEEFAGYTFPSFVLSPNGELAAVSSSPPSSGNLGAGQARFWVIDMAASSQDVVRLSTNAKNGFSEVEVAGWDPESRWVLFWNKYGNSESLDADGSPLRAVELATNTLETVTNVMVSERDQMAWCGDRLLFTDGGGRLRLDMKVIASAGPPLWHKSRMRYLQAASLADPACDAANSSFVAVATPTIGDGAPSLLRWGGNDEPPGFTMGARGLFQPQLSPDGMTTVAELFTAPPGDTELVVIREDESTGALGILGAHSPYALGGAPMWDWHRP